MWLYFQGSNKNFRDERKSKAQKFLKSNITSPNICHRQPAILLYFRTSLSSRGRETMHAFSQFFSSCKISWYVKLSAKYCGLIVASSFNVYLFQQFVSKLTTIASLVHVPAITFWAFVFAFFVKFGEIVLENDEVQTLFRSHWSLWQRKVFIIYKFTVVLMCHCGRRPIVRSLQLRGGGRRKQPAQRGN